MKTNFSDILVTEGIAIADPKLAQQYANAQKQLNDKDAQIIALQKQINALEITKTQIQKAMVAIEQKSAQTIVQAPAPQPTNPTPSTTNQPAAAGQTQSTVQQPTNVTKESFNGILRIKKKVNEEERFVRGLDPKDAMGIGDVQGRKKLVPFNKFPGLEEVAKGFDPFEIIAYKRDPGYGYSNVYMLFLHFIDTRKKIPKWQQADDFKYGLCIYDIEKKEFIEEPGSLEDYGLTAEKVQEKYRFEIPGRVYESSFDVSAAEPEELEEIKNFMDSESIEYTENGDTMEFDENKLDPEWRSMLTDVGIKKLDDFASESKPVLSLPPQETEEPTMEEPELTPEEHEEINEDKVFYVQVEDEGDAFIGKIYKLKDDDEWLSKITVGESETFDKLYYEPEWDEVDIIAFLRDNYADATLISKDEFNQDVLDNDVKIQEAIKTTGRFIISKLEDYKGEKILETHNFERNLDPRQAMGVGLTHFNIEDEDGNQEIERKKTQSWKFKGVTVLSVDGIIGSEQCDLNIMLSNSDKIEFTSFYSNSPRPSQNYAKISFNGARILSVKEEYMDHLQNWGSHVVTVLKLYEDYKNGKLS